MVLFGFAGMVSSLITSGRWLAAIGAAVTIAVLAATPRCQAGIMTPAPIGFDTKDLERELAASKSSGAAVPQHSQPGPDKYGDQSPQQRDYFQTIPANSTSSNSSSSSSGGPSSSIGTAVGALNTALLLADDALLGRLPDEHGLMLPDPPGTDLLRPPRA